MKLGGIWCVHCPAYESEGNCFKLLEFINSKMSDQGLFLFYSLYSKRLLSILSLVPQVVGSLVLQVVGSLVLQVPV